MTTKSDRKLLEQAAICHGVKARWYEKSKWNTLQGRKWKVGDGPRFLAGTEPVFGTHSTKPWNPLEDSALAFSIAAEHDLFFKHEKHVRSRYEELRSKGIGKEQALRKAIVLTLVAVAADIGQLEQAQKAKAVEEFGVQLQKARSKSQGKGHNKKANPYEPGKSRLVDNALTKLGIELDEISRPTWWELVDLFFSKHQMLEEAEEAQSFAMKKSVKVRAVKKTTTNKSGKRNITKEQPTKFVLK